jgi:hypothetical protein
MEGDNKLTFEVPMHWRLHTVLAGIDTHDNGGPVQHIRIEIRQRIA